MLMKRMRGLLILAASIVLMLAIAPAAQAKKVEHERVSETESGSFVACGLEIDFVTDIEFMYMIREDRPGSTAYLYSDVFESRTVLTNVENGEWFVIREKSTLREVKATHVEDDVYLFRMQIAGQPFVVEDSDGKVVMRDRGLVVFEVLFDTLGDDTPGGEELSTELVSMHGPHPGFFLEDEDFCAIALELIG